MTDESIQPSPVAAVLTNRQQQVLDEVSGFIESTGYPPTRSELAARQDCTPNAVDEHLKALERKGYLRLTRGVARGIRVLKGSVENA